MNSVIYFLASLMLCLCSLEAIAATIPCALVHNLCYLEVQLNGSRTNLVLDTGSSYTVLDSDRAAALGFRSSASGHAAGGGIGESSRLDFINGIAIQTGGITLAEQTLVTMPFKYVSKRVGRPTDGTLGANIFMNYVVGFKFGAKQVTLTELTAWNARGAGQAVPLSLEANVPFVHATITLPNGQKIEGKFLVDSGQILSGLLLTEAFKKAHPEILNYKNRIQPPKISAIGGEVEYSVGRVPRIQIGPYQIEEPVTSFLESSTGVYGTPGLAGAIGADLLSRFDLVFDYKQNQMFLNPNSAFDKHDEFDMSGLQVEVVPPAYKHFIITGVMKPSPASQADLREGDVILAVNSLSAENLELSDVQNSLRVKSDHCRLLIQRGHRTFLVTLRLQPLI